MTCSSLARAVLLLLVVLLLTAAGAPSSAADQAMPRLARGPAPLVPPLLLRPATPIPTRGFGWPMQPIPKVARPFDAPPEPWAAGHRGVDLRGSAGQPVLAAGDGTVSFSGVIAGRGVVAVDHASGWRTTYEPLAARVPTGTVVTRGSPIGRLELTGSHCAPSACLHWGLLVARDSYRDPLTLLGSRRPVLLPIR